MVKAIFFDIDGTLMSFETHQIPDSTLTALNQLKAKGIKTFVATGRGKYEFDNLFPFDFDGFITLNGQHCYDSNGKTLYINALNRSDMIELIDYVNINQIACSLTDGNDKHYNLINDAVLSLHKQGNTPVGSVIDLNQLLDSTVLQATVFLDKEKEQQLLKLMPNSTSSRWNDNFCDVSPAGGSKSNGIIKVCSHYGIDIADTMAFGDGGNDIDMLECVASGIAMGNATQNVKDKADYVTDTVDNNGIYNALKHFGVID